MKQTVYSLQSMLLVLMALTGAVSVSAYDFAAKNSEGVTIYYSVSDGNASVSKGNSTDPLYSGMINIPNTVTYQNKEYVVNKIESSAFNGCIELTGINIPSSIVSIGYAAFKGCVSLTHIDLPNSVMNLDEFIFSDCNNLKEVTLPNNLKSIPRYMFDDCSALQKIEIPDGVVSIGQSAFSGCNSLKTITIPSSVKSIGMTAFKMNGLTSITSKITEPFPVQDASGNNGLETFSSESKKNAILYVPVGTKEKYRNTTGWEFEKIVEFDGENIVTLTATNATLQLNKKGEINVNMNNGETNIIAIQFDLTLPEGVSLTNVEKKDRCKDFIVETSDKPVNGKYTVVCYTADNVKTIQGTDGPLFSIVIEANENLADGNLQGIIDNVTIVKEDNTKLYPAESTFSITIDNTLMGDVNGDGSVDVNDITLIVQYIIYKKVDGDFNTAAADMDKDEVIDVADITLVVKAIMEARVNQSRMMTEAIPSNDVLSLVGDGKGGFSLNLKNHNGYIASQFDIQLPLGTTIQQMSLNGERCGNHSLHYQQIEDGIYRVIVYSLENKAYQGDDGSLLAFQLSGSESPTAITNTMFVNADCQKAILNDVSEVSGIGSITISPSASRIYTLDGLKVSNSATMEGLSKGLYIVSGKKYVVK